MQHEAPLDESNAQDSVNSSIQKSEETRDRLCKIRADLKDIEEEVKEQLCLVDEWHDRRDISQEDIARARKGFQDLLKDAKEAQKQRAEVEVYLQNAQEELRVWEQHELVKSKLEKERERLYGLMCKRCT